MKILPSLALAMATGPVLLGSTVAHAHGRRVVVVRPASGTTLARPLPLGRGVRRIANAQLLPDATAQAVDIQGDSLTIAVGDVVLLPFSSVTRIITEDDDVARAFFQNGSPVLQGVSIGTTTVEIYQASNSPRVLTITVVAKGTAPTPVVPLPTPVPVSPPLGENPTVPPTGPDLGAPLPPSTTPDITPQPDPSTVTPPIQPSRSSLTVGLRAIATPGNPGQATFTISYANPGTNVSRAAVVRFTLDDRVSYVTGTASNGGQYDPTKRQVFWNLDDVPAGFTGGQLSLRVEPIERAAFSFKSQATIEDDSGGTISTAEVTYSTTTTPLLTVFAMPDRFLAAASGPTLVDVHGDESQAAVTRLQYMGVLTGRAPGYYYPKQSTQRAEYAVMTLNGLNLRDLRELTQIKFVLSRRSAVSIFVQNAAGKRVADLVRQTSLDAGEHTAPWNGKLATGAFAPPGRYTYVCTAKDGRGEATTLRGTLNLVSSAPLQLEGLPSFVDVKASDWFARYLAVGEKQGLVRGFPDGSFRPRQPISRVEATAIVVRALGLSDVAKQWSDKDVGFLDYTQIPKWARGDVNVATTIAKTGDGRPMMRGTRGNTFDPNAELRRDQAAIIVQRLIDRETTRRVTVSGSIVPGAVVSINSSPISADGTGNFSFGLDVNTSTPTTVAVVDTRGNTF